MKENHTYDELSDIIKSEGLLKPSVQFTQNVMQLIEKAESKADITYKPLLSRTAWFFIALSMFTLLIVSWVLIPHNEPNMNIGSDFIQPVTDFFTGIQLNFRINSLVVILLTAIAGSVGIFFLIDMLITRKQQNSLI